MVEWNFFNIVSPLRRTLLLVTGFLVLMASVQAVMADNYQLSSVLGPVGSGNGQFVNPGGIAIDASGNVYVVDSGNNRIQKFDSSGVFKKTWGRSGSGDGYFNNPMGIAVYSSTGDVYVADTGNNRVQKFDSSGTFITKWGSSGSGNGSFDSPTGIAVDASGAVYVSDKNGIQIFSPQVVVPLVASFTPNVTTGPAPLTVFFTDTSTGTPKNWSWDFGDGSTSHEQNVSHIFTAVGDYFVILTVTNNVGVSNTTSKISVGSLPVANFTENVTEPGASQFISFTDTSTGAPVSWYWNFGDGNTSILQNPPPYFFTSTGDHTVTLTVTNNAGLNNSTNRTFTVFSDTIPPASVTNLQSMNQDATSITWTWTDPENVDFRNVWVFLNGTYYKEIKKGVQTITISGLTPNKSYNTSLQTCDLTNNNNSTLVPNVAMTTQTPITPLVASFNANPTSGSPPLSVQFTDTSTGGPTARDWDFNSDGIIDSHDQNPNHTYTTPGVYTVTLNVSANGQTSPPKTMSITVGTPVITVPTVISEPGTYYMEKDLPEDIPNYGIKITTSNVIIDGNGHTLSRSTQGGNKGGLYGVYVYSETGPLTGVVIRNLTISNWDYGIYFCGTDGIDGKTGFGCTDGGVNNCMITDNQVGLVLSQGCDRMKINGNRFEGSSYYGALLWGVEGTRFFDNKLTKNAENVHLTANPAGTIWDDPQVGTNIMNGPSIGGNYWGDKTGTSTLSSAVDADHDGFADQPYTIKAGAVDQLPLVAYVPPIVTPVPIPQVVALPGSSGLPSDLDNDGLCEDVDGNGQFNFADMTSFFNNQDLIMDKEPVDAFDFNHNGRIDFNDVVVLFNKL